MLLTTVLLACSPGRQSPEGAFDQLRVIIKLGDPSRLYGFLDTESRWALDSVHKTQREIAALVEQFPEPVRSRELARVAIAKECDDAATFLTRTPRFGALFDRLGRDAVGLGRRERIDKVSESEVRVVTDTGLTVPLAKGAEGLWGYSGLRPDLFFWRDAAANDLLRLKEDARLYRGKR